MTLTPEQKAEGWREWNGGRCPIKDQRTRVEAKWHDGSWETGKYYTDPDLWATDGDDRIIAYRIIEAHGEDAEQATEGTLVEIGARVGDMVCPIGGPNFVVTCDHPDAFTGRDGRGYNGPLNMLLKWRIVSRANPTGSKPALPTPFPADYSELVFDADGWSQTIIVDGKRPEWLRHGDVFATAIDPLSSGHPVYKIDGTFGRHVAIRVRRREPKRETVALHLPNKDGSFRAWATIDLIDGKPDLSTIKIGSEA